MSMLKRVFANPFFLTGFFFITFLFIGSFVYSEFFADSYKPSPYLKNKDGIIIALAPLPPSLEFPLGTDKMGKSMIVVLLEGAKYTIGVAVGLSILRMIAGTILGIIIYLLPQKIVKGLTNLFDSFHYAPVVLFAFLLLSPAYIAFNWSYDPNELFYYTLFILAFLSVPVLAIYVAGEIKGVYELEFIRNASLLGGSKLHILYNHVRPFLLPKLSLLFVQQISQLLNLLAHLAILQIFFGGTNFFHIGYDKFGNRTTEPFSISGEWAGLIGKSWMLLTVKPWLVFGPIIAFALTILASNLMVEGIKRATGIEPMKKRKRKTKLKTETEASLSFNKIS
jgi:peptide/nickel transport system permease protein